MILISNQIVSISETVPQRVGARKRTNVKTSTIIEVDGKLFCIEVLSTFKWRDHHDQNWIRPGDRCWQHVQITLSSPTDNIKKIVWVQSQKTMFEHDRKFINRQLAIACRAIAAITRPWHHKLFSKLDCKRHIIIRNFVQAHWNNLQFQVR